MLAYPKDKATFAWFCDASDEGWSAVLTQVENWDADKSVTEQKHELLTCKSGRFSVAQLHWSVTEKEVYPIVAACDDLYYLLLRPRGFTIFCDHRNLIYMFAPSPELKKHTLAECSVERVNRDVLQVLRTMILGYAIACQDWVHLIPLVQANTYHSPVLLLAGKALTEIFTGLPCPSAISTLFVPGYAPISVDTSVHHITESLTALRARI
ncbi:hypothetical protein L914_00969 [Phytophthora nicotianae]|uniref:Reverse transcriptase RNase H-like domain-containing protein n=1 Tax=Phytophthora nicotianae TaxID=4792 RepID=W2P6K0_PHYNI|nr:hypothetical protein L914_00969 [Phytophthora nicotianae]